MDKAARSKLYVSVLKIDKAAPTIKMRRQNTIKNTVSFEGIGLHCGINCQVSLLSAPASHGIVFHRIDTDTLIPANLDNIVDTSFATTIGIKSQGGSQRGVSIQTVEHLLSAIEAFDIDNCLIEVNGPEIPILDGSALGIINILEKAGILEQDKPIQFLRILKPFLYSKNDSSIMIEPSEEMRISLKIEYKRHFIGEQRLSIVINKKSFIKEIAPARTYGFLRDVDYLRSKGLAKGGSLDNALVFTDTGILKSQGNSQIEIGFEETASASLLRFQDECVRHKILDMIGDLSFLSIPILGHISAEKSGHAMNIAFLRELLKNIDHWEIINC